MKKGIVISLALGHKNGKTVLKNGDKVTENDVNNFDDCVKNGHIKIEENKKVENKKEQKKF